MSDLSQMSDDELLSQLSDDELKVMAGGMGIEPSEVQQQASQGGFDPQTALESYGQELTYGYLPQLQAATEKGITSGLATIGVGPGAVNEQLRQQGFVLPEQSLVDLKNENIRRIQAQQQQSPVSSMVGTGVGMAAQLAPLARSVRALAGLGKGKAVVEAGKVAGGVGRPATKAALTGAGLSGLVNPEQNIESEDFVALAPKERAAAAAAGGFFSGIVQKALPKTGVAASQKSSEKAVSSLGGTLSDVVKLKKRGLLNDLGKTLVDEKIVTPLATPETIKLRLDERMNSLAGEVTDLIKSMERKMNDPGFTEKYGRQGIKELGKAAFIPEVVALRVKNEIMEKYSELPEQMIRPALRTVDRWLLNLPSAEKGFLTPSEVQNAKTQLNRFLKDSDFLKTDTTLAKEGLKAVRRSLMEGVENYADAFSRVDKSKSGKDLKALNKKLGSLIEASKLAEKGEARAIKNRSISLTDTISGGTGASIGGYFGGPSGAAIGGLLGAGANKLAREFGDQASAVGYRQLSRLPELPPEATAVLSAQAIRRLKALGE